MTERGKEADEREKGSRSSYQGRLRGKEENVREGRKKERERENERDEK